MLILYSMMYLVPVVFFLYILNHIVPSLGLSRRPDRPLRPTPFLVMVLIALVAVACFLDVPEIREQHHWSGSAVLVCCEVGFIATAVGLRMRLRQSLLAWVSSCFFLACVFTMLYAFLAFVVFYAWGVYH